MGGQGGGGGGLRLDNGKIFEYVFPLDPINVMF